jgi:hypothetical protein
MNDIHRVFVGREKDQFEVLAGYNFLRGNNSIHIDSLKYEDAIDWHSDSKYIKSTYLHR